MNKIDEHQSRITQLEDQLSKLSAQKNPSEKSMGKAVAIQARIDNLNAKILAEKIQILSGPDTSPNNYKSPQQIEKDEFCKDFSENIYNGLVRQSKRQERHISDVIAEYRERVRNYNL